MLKGAMTVIANTKNEKNGSSIEVISTISDIQREASMFIRRVQLMSEKTEQLDQDLGRCRRLALTATSQWTTPLQYVAGLKIIYSIRSKANNTANNNSKHRTLKVPLENLNTVTVGLLFTTQSTAIQNSDKNATAYGGLSTIKHQHCVADMAYPPHFQLQDKRAAAVTATTYCRTRDQWMKILSNDWWDSVVLMEFTDSNWRGNFRIKQGILQMAM